MPIGLSLRDRRIYFGAVDEDNTIHCIAVLWIGTVMGTDEMNLANDDNPGVYIIRCMANNATYTGSSLQARKRLQLHVSLLRAGSCLVELMQRDWDTFGEEQFEFLLCQKPPEELYYWEEQMTLLTDSLDDYGGFNKMLGNRVWSLSSRIKNTEQKLINKRKFSPLAGRISNPRLMGSYIRTFCQGSIPFFKSEPLLSSTVMDSSAKHLMLRELLAEYGRFEPTKPKACH